MSTQPIETHDEQTTDPQVRARLIAACSTPLSPDPRVIRFRVIRAARAAFLARKD